MSGNIPIFFTGATGYIGGAVLARLLDHPSASKLDITALSRSEEKAKKIQELGSLQSVVGSYADHDLLERLASAADVVIATVDADDLGAAKAILGGMKKRFDVTGKPPILIHTSGTGVLIDNAQGMFTTDVIYDDLNVEQIATLAPSQPHREVDIAIQTADQEGFVKTFIILPSTIYGIADHKLVKAGISNPYSQQIPAVIKTSLSRGQAGMIGQGKNLWPNVHIDEIADLYVVLFDHLLANPSTTGHGPAGYYFGESGEHQLKSISDEVGKNMVELGKSQTAEPSTYTEEETLKFFGGGYNHGLGSNSRCRANRSRSVGWKTWKSTADMIASIRPEMDAILASS